MKIKNIKTNHIKLTKLQLIKSKNYKNTENRVNSFTTEFYLKKSLNIIYKYHINNKKIIAFFLHALAITTLSCSSGQVNISVNPHEIY